MNALNKLVLFLILFSFKLIASADAGINRFISEGEFSVFVDTADLSFSELLLMEQGEAISFQTFNGGSPQAPIIWVKIPEEELGEAEYLYLSNYMDRIEVFYPDSAGYYSIGGRIIDYDQRSFRQGFYRNVVAIFPNKGSTYLKISSFHGYSIQNQSLSHIQAVSAEELNSDTTKIFTSITLITGMEIIILIINLTLWWLSRDRTVGFYISVIATGMGMAIIKNQTFFHFFEFSMELMGWVEIIFNFILIYFFHAFSSHYLLAKEHSPKIHKALTLPFFPILLVLVFIQNGVAFPTAATIYVLTSFVLIFTLIYRGWRLHKKRAIIYVTANFTIILLALILVLALNEVIPHRFLTTNLPFLGFLIRDTIFTIDLIRRHIDISKNALERKITIEQLTEEKGQMKKMEEIKTRFFNNASHELRTPLTLIISPLEEIIKSGNIPKELKKELSLSLKNGKYLLQLVNEMLDLAKLDNEELALRRENVEVVSLIASIQENFQAYATEKKQRLFISHTSQKLIARLDKDKFEKIINNLISNAIKYSRNRAGDIFIQIIEKGSTLEIRVQDEGIGISANEIPQIFDRYYQSEKTNAQGTGIGLSIVKEFVELHGGNVKCHSQPGWGSLFILEFPNAITNDESSVGRSDVVFDPKKATILLLEDNTELRTYLTNKLSDYNIHACENGAEGLQSLSNNLQPDLILTDYVMPEVDGYEFVSTIKKNTKWASIPIIFLTARTLSEDKVAVLNLGIDDYIIKPFDLDELKVRIKMTINTAQGIQEISMQETDLEDTSVNISVFKRALDDFILEQIANEKLSNEDLYGHFSISERNLFRKVKMATGKAPASYIREIRLQHGRNLLTNNHQATVSEIAYQCGINNASHFTQLFKKRFGTTPSKMQSQHSA